MATAEPSDLRVSWQNSSGLYSAGTSVPRSEEESMSVSSRKSSRLSGFLNWIPCLRNASVDEGIPPDETTWEGPCGMHVLDGLAKFEIGKRRQARQIYLCTNVLLISNRKFKSKFRIEHFVPLHTMWVSNCLEESARASSRAHRSLTLGWSSVSFVVSFFSGRRKEEWFYFLHRYIKLAKNKVQLKSAVQHSTSEQVENRACASEEGDQVPVCFVKNENPHALKDVFSEDDATRTVLSSIIKTPQKQGLLVTMSQNTNILTTTASMEHVRQSYLPNHAYKALSEQLVPALMTHPCQGASADRVYPYVPLYNKYAFAYPMFPEDDLMTYVSLVPDSASIAPFL